MPHEQKVRAWLARARLSREDIDDVVQETYCRIAKLGAVDHIVRPDAYFFSAVRNILSRKIRRAKIVPFEAIDGVMADQVPDDRPSPERMAAANISMARLHQYMKSLPTRCRKIVELRKFEELSQKEIARRMQVTESVVENDLVKGMRLIQEAWRSDFEEAENRFSMDGPKGNTK